jgi:uncharacterized protein YcbK (DUF882 family)
VYIFECTAVVLTPKPQKECRNCNVGGGKEKEIACYSGYRYRSSSPVLFKNSVRTAKKTQHFTGREMNWLTLFKEAVAITVTIT